MFRLPDWDHLIVIGKVLFKTATPSLKSQGPEPNSKAKAVLWRTAAKAGELYCFDKKDALGWHLSGLQKDKGLGWHQDEECPALFLHSFLIFVLLRIGQVGNNSWLTDMGKLQPAEGSLEVEWAWYGQQFVMSTPHIFHYHVTHCGADTQGSSIL